MRRKTVIQLWLCLFCLLPLHLMAQTLEYWFDDNFDSRNSTTIATSDAEQELSLDLQNSTKFPFGFHKLNMRIIIGGKPSAVYSSPVLKLSAGKATQLEYWIDNDYANAKTISGSLASNGQDYLFVNDLDLGDVSPGYHRLYCRAVSNSQHTASAVTMTPIIVKSKYYTENPEDLTVTKQAYWFDNEDPKIEHIANPKNDYKQSYSFDARKLSDGQHTLHVQYSNSAGFWSSPTDYAFTKTAVIDPVIVANAIVENGVVTMNFTSIPNGFTYTLVRQYPSGKNHKANDVNSTEYPANLKATDTPAPGSYTYYVEGKYIDADGKTQKVRSEDISVTVDKAAETVKRGRIHGALKINGNPITYEWFVGRYDVYINGQKASDTDYPFKKENYGHFRIEDVPYGTELSIGVGYHDGGLSSQLITLIVNENTSNNTYYFDCTEDGEDGFLTDNNDYDILMWDRIHLTPNGWELGVKNKSEYRPWSGNIIVKVMSKKAYEMFEKQKNGELSLTYFMINPDAVSYEPSFVTSANAHVRFDKNEYKSPLILDVIDLPKRNENEDYYVCVYSQKDGEEQMKVVGENLMTVKFNPYEMEVAVVNGFKNYMAGYAEVMRIFKSFAAWGDPFKLAWESVTDKNFELWLKNFEDGHTDFSELIQDEADVAFRSAGLLLNCFFSDMDKAVKKYTGTFKETTTYKLHSKMQELYNDAKDVMGVVNASQADDSHRFFELAKQVLKFSKKLNDEKIYDPVFEVYKTYFEVGEAMASAVERLGNSYSGRYVWERLVSGKGEYKIKVRKYTTDDKSVEYFHGKDVNSQISSINIVLSTPAQSGLKVNSTTYEKVYDPDGITIKNVEFPGKYNTNYTPTEAWMAITWANKRVTYVPLLNNDFVKMQHFSQLSKEPLTMTVELQSDTYWDLNRLANKLTFVKP